MKNRKFTLWAILSIITIAAIFQACGSSKRGCDGKKKTRTDMGWM